MIIGNVDFNKNLEKKLGPVGVKALIKFVDEQKKSGHEDEWDGVSFEAGWRAAVDITFEPV